VRLPRRWSVVAGLSWGLGRDPEGAPAWFVRSECGAIVLHTCLSTLPSAVRVAAVGGIVAPGITYDSVAGCVS
jgi:hypothetical protein